MKDCNMEEKNKKEVNNTDSKELDRYERIVNRAHKEISGVRYVYMFLAGVLGTIFVVGMGIATFIGFSTVGDIKSRVEERVNRLEKRVEERIEEQFAQKNIQKLVEEKASERIDNVADKLIGEKINEKVTPLISEVENKIEDMQSRLVATEEKVNQIITTSDKRLKVLEEDTEKNLKATKVQSEFLLTVLRAQSGDKESWLYLAQIADNQKGTELGKFAAVASQRIYDDYFKTTIVNRNYYKPNISNNEVVEKLKGDLPSERKTAVYTIEKRSMYDQIPILIAMMPREENLDVLSEIYRVLNELLKTNIKMTTNINKDASRFENEWEAKKKQLEEIKGDSQP